MGGPWDGQTNCRQFKKNARHNFSAEICMAECTAASSLWSTDPAPSSCRHRIISLGVNNERSGWRITLSGVHLWPTFCCLKGPTTILPQRSVTHYSLLNNVKVYMHERWSRGEDRHNRAISLSPSAHMLIMFTPLPPKPHMCLSDEPVTCHQISWQFSSH